MIKIDTEITDDFIKEVVNRLSEDKQIRRTLPNQGRLHIDRKLPYLCVYRRPLSNPDNGTDQLIKGEASYLITSSKTRHNSGIKALIRAIVETMSSDTGAFLIIEIWSRELPVVILDPERGRTAPSFRLLIPPDRIPIETIESLNNALTNITVSKNRGIVETDFSNHPWPEKLPALFSLKEIKTYNCYLIGLEILPIFRNPDTNEIYPLVLKKIHRGLSKAFKKAAYEFSHKRTTVRPPSYKSLGRQAVVKAVWEVDNRLAELGNKTDFLLLVTPINIEQSWNKFKTSRFNQLPVFYYRPIPVDPSVLKRNLYAIPFDRIEDPVLSSIFHRKIMELEMKYSMLRDRNTKNFFYGSMHLYGEIDSELFGLAIKILEKISPHSHEINGSSIMNAKSFASLAESEIQYFKEKAATIKSKVIIRKDITGLMVSNGNLFIGDRLKVPDSRVEALIQHEVGTHVLTFINGKDQPFQQLYSGLAGCDELQEGLAVLSEYLVGGLSPPRLRLLAGRVVAAKMLISGGTFIDTYRELNITHGFAQRTSYVITSRIYRSGGYTKDAVYLRGLVSLVDYIRKGGDMEPLLVGKMSIEDVPVIKELQLRKVLKPALLRPRYMDDPLSQSKLNEIRNGTQILKLI